MDFPLPVVPTIPTMSPGSIVTLTSESTFFVRSNEKLTFPELYAASYDLGLFAFKRRLLGSASRMSSIRSAASALWYESERYAKKFTGP